MSFYHVFKRPLQNISLVTFNKKKYCMNVPSGLSHFCLSSQLHISCIFLQKNCVWGYLGTRNRRGRILSYVAQRGRQRAVGLTYRNMGRVTSLRNNLSKPCLCVYGSQWCSCDDGGLFGASKRQQQSLLMCHH